MKRLITSSLLLFQFLFVFAQTGSISGTVTDANNGETLIGTTVMFKGTTTGTITDFDGNYTIDKVQPGKYILLVSFISYNPQELEIEVKSGQETKTNIALAPATLEIEGVEVVAKANRETESMLLVEQKNAVLATQAIGAQEISRKGASDAEAAVTKVSGISKQEGVKNVFVRGLGDRFNATTLNGFPVPSEDPEYKNISLDFFSSDIIKAIGVKKVFSSDVTGDVAGAVIDISSKELIGSDELNVNLSAKANTRSLTADFLVPDGVSTLGFGENKAAPASELTYDFKNSLDPSAQSFQLGKSFGLSGGKRFDIGHNPLSVYFVGAYDNDYYYSDGVTRESTTNGTVFRDQSTRKYDRKSSHLGMVNANYLFGSTTLAYNLMLVHTANEGVRDDWGLNSEVFQEAEDRKGYVRRQQVNLNTLVVNQFDLKKEINKHWSANIGVSYNYTNGKEPDRRVNYLSYVGNDEVSPLRGSGRQHRYYSNLNENDLNTLARAVYKFTEDENNVSSVEFGYTGRFLTDRFKSNSWDNSRTQAVLPTLGLYDFSLDAIFNQEEFAVGHFVNDQYNISEYTVSKFIHSGFAAFNYQVSSALIVNVGLKTDLVDLKVDYNVNDGAKKDSRSMNKFYVLPNLNLKYAFTDKQALRLGASRTYTLPQSKEISPLLYEGPQWSSQGNPNLVPSVNYNLDLKWDYYLSRNELISVTAFGKLIQNPISKVEVNSAGGFLSYANIAPKATLAGLEVEIRKDLFNKTSEDLFNASKLSTGINFSVINTGVKTDSQSAAQSSSIPLNFTNEKTQLEGASPFIINGDLSYHFQHNDFELNTSVVAGYVSQHIYSIGVNGFNDIKESGIPTLDFISSLKLNEHFGLSFKARNLLDPEYQLTRVASVDAADAIVLSSYRKGMELSFGIAYTF